MLIETVNMNIWTKCDLRCTYCYGRFPDQPRVLTLDEWRAIIQILAEAKVRRVTFCGGEPTLNPDLEAMISHAHELGLQTSIVTNGARLTDAMIARLIMVGMTLDSDDPSTLHRLGRTTAAGADYLSRFLDVARRVRRHRTHLKINTVVTRLNLGSDLTDILLELRPTKWKPMQFTSVEGENEAEAPHLRVSAEEFGAFVARHRTALEEAGIWVEPETEPVVRSTYVMLDPSGRIFQTTGGRKRFSAPVLEVGFERALSQAGGYDRGAFLARGGHVDVRRLPLLGDDHGT